MDLLNQIVQDSTAGSRSIAFMACNKKSDCSLPIEIRFLKDAIDSMLSPS